jgi:hypothetical protein
MRCVTPHTFFATVDLPRIPRTVLYEKIRACPRADRVPIVVVTGVADAPALPGAVVVRKPVTPVQLIK